MSLPRKFRDRQERRRQLMLRDPERRSKQRRQPILDWIPLFRDADQGLVKLALSDCEVLELPAGTALLTPGRANDCVYIPLSGQVSASLANSGVPSNSIPIAAGECVGELSTIDGKPVSAWVRVDVDARVLRIPRDIFWNRLMTLPSVARNLQTTLTERLRSTNDMALQAQREQLELQHLRKELGMAHQLQASMLPLQRPLFPERSDIEVCGLMEPATSVGGDLFDAFFVDDDTLFFCIGDVSGHGIASALFMARAIGLLRLLAISVDAPDRLLVDLNNRLCHGNESNIFVTLFCGFLNVRTGRLHYSNGGHCPPALRTADSLGFIPIPKGPLIGAMPNVRYSAMTMELAPGDLLFCYTDGITEAQTAVFEEFGEERCLGLLDALMARPLSEILDAFRAEVARFTGSQVLEDDCTMLALRRSAPE